MDMDIMLYHKIASDGPQHYTVQYHGALCDTTQKNEDMQYHFMQDLATSGQHHDIIVKLCDIMCDFMEQRAISWNVTPYHAISCNSMPYLAILCDFMLYQYHGNHTVPCHWGNIMPYHANVMHYHTISREIMRHHAISTDAWTGLWFIGFKQDLYTLFLSLHRSLWPPHRSNSDDFPQCTNLWTRRSLVPDRICFGPKLLGDFWCFKLCALIWTWIVGYCGWTVNRTEVIEQLKMVAQICLQVWEDGSDRSIKPKRHWLPFPTRVKVNQHQPTTLKLIATGC